MREGDVILSLDNTEVTSAKQFETLVAKVDKAQAGDACWCGAARASTSCHPAGALTPWQ